MYYPEEFKTKVKQIYPDDFCGLYDELESGNVFVEGSKKDRKKNRIKQC